MSNSKLRVGIDLDGVCYDFGASFKRYLRQCGCYEKYGVTDDEPTTWNFFLDWGMSVAEFVQHCHEGVEAGVIFRGCVRDDAPSALRKIKDAGHEIHIVTDRSFGKTPESSQRATREWLAEHGFVYDTLTFSADKTSVPTDVFVEDKLENYDALIAAGVNAMLVDRPWNQDGTDYRFRIDSVQEYANILSCISVN